MLAKHGTYALILLSAADQLIEIGKLGRFAVPRGFYVYVGSARGPGGLKARIAHHERISQRPHWHMDYLRPALHLKEVWYTYDSKQHEHYWAEALGCLRRATIPIAGFGSSDCSCKSHLFLFTVKPSIRLFCDKLRSKCNVHSKNNGLILKRKIIITEKNGVKKNEMVKKMNTASLKLKFFPVTKGKWTDFETLFGERGACGGCWCMFWRLTRKEFDSQKGEGNRKAMKAIVQSGKIPGILAFAQNRPVAWCSVAPRDQFSALDRSRILKPVDNLPVWSISCFFVEKHYRAKGLSIQMIKAAVDYVKKNGGSVVEAYPVQPKKDKMPDAFAWTGLASAFIKAGFAECARRSETRPIMRFYIED